MKVTVTLFIRIYDGRDASFARLNIDLPCVPEIGSRVIYGDDPEDDWANVEKIDIYREGIICWDDEEVLSSTTIEQHFNRYYAPWGFVLVDSLLDRFGDV